MVFAILRQTKKDVFGHDEGGHDIDSMARTEYPTIIDTPEDEAFFWEVATSKSMWEDEFPLMARLGEEIQCEMANLGSGKNEKEC